MLEGVPGFLPQLAQGTLVTLQVSLASLVLSLAAGLLLAVVVLYGPRPGRAIIRGYITVVRGIPELLIIFAVYFGGTVALSSLFGHYVEIDGFSAGVFALAVVNAAYFCEIFRGALQTVAPGQAEAGRSLGLSARQIFFSILLPQMAAHALPGAGNQWLVLLKESALISVVGLEELMRKSTIGAGATYNALGFYVVAALIYIAITTVSTILITLADKRMSFGQTDSR